MKASLEQLTTHGQLFSSLCYNIDIMSKALLPVLLSFVGLLLSVGVLVAAPRAQAATQIKQYQEFLEGTSAEEQNNSQLTERITYNFFSTVYDSILNNADGGGIATFFTTSMVAMYNNPPAETKVYVADLLKSAGVATPAYAQGFGFAALSPLLEAWKQFRNLAYLFFVVIFIVIGFMIMLRRRVGQAAITAQQAIPSVIIALLAVTFSYAIAGLLIDMMYVVMFVLLALFGKASSSTDVNFFMGHNVFSFGFKLVIGSFGDAKDAVSDYVDSLINIPLINAAGLDWLSGITAGVIIAIAVTVAVFGIFFELLKTYITIILSIVLAPVALMMGAIPGRNTFGPWVKSLIGNLVAFPTMLLILLIYDMLTGGVTGTAFKAQSGLNVADTGDGTVLAQGPDVTGQRDNLTMPYINVALTDEDGGGNIASAAYFIIGFGLLMGAKEAIVQAKKAAGASDGGVMATILGAGWKRAYSKRKGPLAAATALTGGALGAAGGAASGLLTGLRRGERGAALGQTMLRRTGVGALGGAVLTPAVTGGLVPKLVKGAAGVVVKQGQDYVGLETIGRAANWMNARGSAPHIGSTAARVGRGLAAIRAVATGTPAGTPPPPPAVPPTPPPPPPAGTPTGYTPPGAPVAGTPPTVPPNIGGALPNP